VNKEYRFRNSGESCECEYIELDVFKSLHSLYNISKTTDVCSCLYIDVMVHRTHRHEPPVHGSITLVADTSDLVAVSKPASMPMHPCGSYHHNTLTHVLVNEHVIPNQPPLMLVHRLDRYAVAYMYACTYGYIALIIAIYFDICSAFRVTSGLVILAKTKEAASRISKEIFDNKTQKVSKHVLEVLSLTFPSDLFFSFCSFRHI
jgi:hypothetical protein